MNYLLVGPEEYLRYQFLEKLKKSVLSKNENQLDFELFRAGEKKFTETFNSFRTLPFISKHKIIVVRDIDRFSSREKDSILKYLKSPCNSTTLVLVSSSNEFNKFLQESSKFTKIIRCSSLKPGELNLWIKREFAARKKKISLDLANLIRKLVGGDLFLLKNEIEKMVSFLGDMDAVTEGHIEALFGKTTYKTAFELMDLVLDKRMDKVLLSVDSLLTKEKPHQILSLLAWQFRNFIKIKNLPDGLSIEEIAGELDINRHFAQRAVERAGRFNQSNLEKNLEVILETDLFIKRGKMVARDALERALVELCR